MKTGKIIVGTVHDCNKKVLDRLLKNFDNQLYLKWNPHKNSGIGTWELRRLPDKKTAIPKWELGEQVVFELQYVEDDLIHHVMDLPALHYGVLDKLREMDTWQYKDFVSEIEYKEDKQRDLEFKRNKEELKYNIRYHKKAFEDFRELVRSGHNMADLLRGQW